MDLYLVCGQVLESDHRAHKAFVDTAKREPNGRPIQHPTRDMQRRFADLCKEAIVCQQVPMLSNYALQTLTSRICCDWLKAELDEWELKVKKPFEYGEWS